MTIEVITNPTHVETYQTLYVGLLGFAGVIITLIINSLVHLKQLNSQKQRELKLRADQIKHEANTLRVALKSELLLNRDSYELRVEQLSQPVKDRLYSVIPTITFNVAYLALLDKVGLLTENEVEKVLKAYQLIDELPYRIKNLIRAEKVGEIHDEYIKLYSGSEEIVVDIHKVFIIEINNAIKTIDKYLNTDS